MRQSWVLLLLMLLLMLLLLLLLLLVLLSLLLLLVLRHAEHFGVDLSLGWARSNSRRGGELSWPSTILTAAAFVKMDQLLVADE